MKKYLLFTLIALFGINNLKAAEIKENALYCISLKKVESYYNYLEKGFEGSAQKLINDSDCFIKKRTEKALFKSETDKYIELEDLKGFTIWTKKENIKK